MGHNMPAMPSAAGQAVRLLLSLIHSVGEGHDALTVLESGRARSASAGTHRWSVTGETAHHDADHCPADHAL